MSHYEDQFDKDDYGDEDNGDQLSQDTPDQIDQLSDIELIKDEDGSNEDSNRSDSQSESDSSCSNRHIDKDEYVEVMNQGEAYPQPNKIKITNPYISKYEKALIIGKRAEQIANSSPIYVQIDWSQPVLPNPLQVAEKEYQEGKIPFIVRRYLPNGQFEDWKLQQLKK